MFTELDIKKTPKLCFVRQSFYLREYKLTDHTHIYGALRYEWLRQREAIVKTASHQWRFGFWSMFSRLMTIANENGEPIGHAEREYFSRTYTLNLNSGFRAKFYRQKLFSRQYIWECDGYGKIVTIENNFPFALNNNIVVEPSQAPVSVIPLLVFFGMHLTIYRRGRSAVR